MSAAAVPELAFDLVEVAPRRFAALPTIDFTIGIERSDGGSVQCVILTVTIAIAAARRPYDPAEEERLFALFGSPGQWDTSLRSLIWTRTTTAVPAFTGQTHLTVSVTCGHDLQVAATRYLHAVKDGDIPLELVFGGTIFYADGAATLRAGQIPWRHEVAGRLPARIWHELMHRYYGTSRWLRLEDRRFDMLAAYMARHAHPSFDDTVEGLLKVAEERMERSRE
jgi:Family of unknown function (DUF6084)